MVDSDSTLVLVPLIPALAFMWWVIWALEKQIQRDQKRSDVMARAKAGTDRLPAPGASLKKHIKRPSFHIHSGQHAH